MEVLTIAIVTSLHKMSRNLKIFIKVIEKGL